MLLKKHSIFSKKAYKDNSPYEVTINIDIFGWFIVALLVSGFFLNSIILFHKHIHFEIVVRFLTKFNALNNKTEGLIDSLLLALPLIGFPRTKLERPMMFSISYSYEWSKIYFSKYYGHTVQNVDIARFTAILLTIELIWVVIKNILNDRVNFISSKAIKKLRKNNLSFKGLWLSRIKSYVKSLFPYVFYYIITLTLFKSFDIDNISYKIRNNLYEDMKDFFIFLCTINLALYGFVISNSNYKIISSNFKEFTNNSGIIDFVKKQTNRVVIINLYQWLIVLEVIVIYAYLDMLINDNYHMIRYIFFYIIYLSFLGIHLTYDFMRKIDLWANFDLRSKAINNYIINNVYSNSIQEIIKNILLRNIKPFSKKPQKKSVEPDYIKGAINLIEENVNVIIKSRDINNFSGALKNYIDFHKRLLVFGEIRIKPDKINYYDLERGWFYGNFYINIFKNSVEALEEEPGFYYESNQIILGLIPYVLTETDCVGLDSAIKSQASLLIKLNNWWQNRSLNLIESNDVYKEALKNFILQWVAITKIIFKYINEVPNRNIEYQKKLFEGLKLQLNETLFSIYTSVRDENKFAANYLIDFLIGFRSNIHQIEDKEKNSEIYKELENYWRDSCYIVVAIMLKIGKNLPIDALSLKVALSILQSNTSQTPRKENYIEHQEEYFFSFLNTHITCSNKNLSNSNSLESLFTKIYNNIQEDDLIQGVYKYNRSNIDHIFEEIIIIAIFIAPLSLNELYQNKISNNCYREVQRDRIEKAIKFLERDKDLEKYEAIFYKLNEENNYKNSIEIVKNTFKALLNNISAN